MVIGSVAGATTEFGRNQMMNVNATREWSNRLAICRLTPNNLEKEEAE